jgi:hypothetical protein
MLTGPGVLGDYSPGVGSKARQDVVGVRIQPGISHEELSEMVGTTRPGSASSWQRFRELGLVETGTGRCLLVKKNKLDDYLVQAV